LHLLNITNDLPADTPSDCARKCFEEVFYFVNYYFEWKHPQENCKIAGFIPTPGHESAGGICLITTNFNEKCSNDVRHTPQHASTVPFLIECIRCSGDLGKKNIIWNRSHTLSTLQNAITHCLWSILNM
jgi:hypothetical protein